MRETARLAGLAGLADETQPSIEHACRCPHMRAASSMMRPSRRLGNWVNKQIETLCFSSMHALGGARESSGCRGAWPMHNRCTAGVVWDRALTCPDMTWHALAGPGCHGRAASKFILDESRHSNRVLMGVAMSRQSGVVTSTRHLITLTFSHIASRPWKSRCVVRCLGFRRPMPGSSHGVYRAGASAGPALRL